MRLQKIQNLLSQPLAVGFGISKPEHVRKLSPYADALIIGSALVAIIEREKKRLEKSLKIFYFI